MGVPTPFHERTLAACKSLSWREWAGFFAVSTYEVVHDAEYEAIRHSAGLLDVSPLFKYDLTGPDAVHVLDRILTRNVTKLAVGQVAYGGWCTEHGFMMDDGTVTRLEDEVYRLTASGPNLRWIEDAARGKNVKVVDTSDSIAALALQGPTARSALKQVCDADLDRLKYFRVTRASIAGKPVLISRTGYTGDLGYEVFLDAKDALPIWDAILAGGKDFGVVPVGLLALDMVRLEAGLILSGVDYQSARTALVRNQLYTPFEAGLGWTVDFKDHTFIGAAALKKQTQQGIPRQIVGLMMQWEPLEALFERAGLPPQLPCSTSRVPVPVYKSGRQVGRATSTVWSPVLKRYIALATIDAPHDAVGSTVNMETTVNFERHTVPAVVTRIPFFDPPRKKSIVQ